MLAQASQHFILEPFNVDFRECRRAYCAFRGQFISCCRQHSHRLSYCVLHFIKSLAPAILRLGGGVKLSLSSSVSQSGVNRGDTLTHVRLAFDVAT
jgi:hypothetical protein